MRLSRNWPAAAALAFSPYAVCAQTGANDCEPAAALQTVSPDRNTGITIAQIRQALERSPDNLFLNRWLIEQQPKPQTGTLAGEFREKLAAHPDDPRYQFLYARALVGKDTPAAIRSFQKLIAEHPSLPWTYLALTQIYASAAFRDAAKLETNMRAYQHVCPVNLDAFEYLNAIDDERSLRELAGALRAQLQTAREPWQLRYYPALWAAEFRLTPLAELEQARKLVAEDLKRIEAVSRDDDQSVLDVLSTGYRLSAQSEDEKRIGARIAAARPRYPVSEAYQAWQKEKPNVSGNRAEALYQASAAWTKQWPDDPASWYWRRDSLVETRSHSADDWKEVADALTRTSRLKDLHSLKHSIAQDWVAADVMVPEAAAMLRDLLDWSETDVPAQSDLIQGTIAADLDGRSRAEFRFAVLVTLAEAATKLKDFDRAHATLNKLHQWLETDFPKYYDQDPMNFPDREGRYVNLMGRLAQAEGRKLDALAYYHQLITNPIYIREYAGPISTARALFKELGGTDEAWAVWSKVQPWPAGKPDPPRGWPVFAWNAVNRALPEMHVPDAAGRNWTLADFKGKPTFVFLWATWCAPCWRELPGMQKLYDAVKNRDDVQVISLSMDENPAIVTRFMQERKLNFPVLVSKSYVERVLPEVVLGQTWVIDGDAKIRLQRQPTPYLEQLWVDEALDKLNHPPQPGVN